MEFMTAYWDKIDTIRDKLNNADAIVVGCGAGLSAACGFDYYGERFDKYFGDFKEKYGIKDMYSGGFYPFESLEEYWAWWSRQIFVNRYDNPIGKPYEMLLDLVKDKNYFVITTNVDHQFQRAGFDKKRLFYTQGDYGLWQCSVPCHSECYDNREIVEKMYREQKNMKVPSELVPYCPKCGKPMTMNLRVDDSFVQDKGWYSAMDRYENFIGENCNKNIVFLEIGVGGNTPVIIKYPFWEMTSKYKRASYICLNRGEANCPFDIKFKSVCVNEDVRKILGDLGR